ncbi:MAG: trypsin-like serine protease [Chloroflexi bacterium]|nr:MAG: trypsin-like serine protease [Chloroflexota bacterium]
MSNLVAQEFFDDRSPAPAPAEAPAAPPASPPPKRFRGRLAAAVLALAVTGGTGSGALAAEHSTPTVAAASTSGTTSTTSTSTQSSTTAESVYKQVSPGVVTITAAVSGGRGQVGQATGSGIVLDTKGDILTNDHVIAGGTQIQVTFSDGTSANATLVGSNAGADLAVLRVSVPASSLHPVTLGNSSNVQIGDSVYAIGSPFGLSGSLSEGIVSNLNQTGSAPNGGTMNGLLQTDAAINPGNSGGPLVNAQGQVIGINNSIESPVDGNVGVGFAIPINQVTQVLSSLEGGSNV